MHHKRGKPKNSRAGCLWCKPHKMNSAPLEWQHISLRRAEEHLSIKDGLEDLVDNRLYDPELGEDCFHTKNTYTDFYDLSTWKSEKDEAATKACHFCTPTPTHEDPHFTLADAFRRAKKAA